jgi:hypothetical protein
MVGHILAQARAMFGQTELLPLLAKLVQSDQPLFVSQARDMFWQLVDPTDPATRSAADEELVDMMVTSHPNALSMLFGQDGSPAVDPAAVLQAAVIRSLDPAAQALPLSPVAIRATITSLARRATPAAQAETLLALAHLSRQGHGTAQLHFVQLLERMLDAGQSRPALRPLSDFREVLAIAASACPNRFFDLTRQLGPLRPPPPGSAPALQQWQLAATMVAALKLSAHLGSTPLPHMETP